MDWSSDGSHADDDVPHTDVRLPPVAGFYDGQQVFFVHPETSDAEVAEALTDIVVNMPMLTWPGGAR